MYKTVLFDLDGTITDSEPGIIACVQHALRQFGIEVENPNTLRPFIGPPLRDSFRDYFQMTPEEAEQARNAGVQPVWLGPRILRCETAPVTALSLLMYLSGNL